MLRESEAYGPSSFQSTLSMRRATLHVTRTLRCVRISIHALHEESDLITSSAVQTSRKISIHALHEESDFHPERELFAVSISIHALHEESDCTIPVAYYANRYFNPRSP